MESVKVPREMHVKALTPELCAGRVSEILQRNYGHIRCATKRIAQRISADPRAVENWLYGKHAPRMHDLIALAAECEDLAEEINRLITERKCSLSTSS